MDAKTSRKNTGSTVDNSDENHAREGVSENGVKLLEWLKSNSEVVKFLCSLLVAFLTFIIGFETNIYKFFNGELEINWSSMLQTLLVSAFFFVAVAYAAHRAFVYIQKRKKGVKISKNIPKSLVLAIVVLAIVVLPIAARIIFPPTEPPGNTVVVPREPSQICGEGTAYSIESNNEGRVLIFFPLDAADPDKTTIDDDADRTLFNKWDKIKVIKIEEGISCIGENVFKGNEDVEFISIPASLEIIGMGAFENCKKLKAVEIAPKSKLEIIDERAFCDCSSLENFRVPVSTIQIGVGAFSGCSNLKDFEFEERPGTASLALGKSAFQECTSLTRMVIPEGVQSVQKYTFLDCTELVAVRLPDGIRIIDEEAFKNCVRLLSIKLPDTVEEIRAAAFRGCESIREIEIPGSTTFIGLETFRGCADLNQVSILRGGIGSGVTFYYDTFRQCPKLSSVAFEWQDVVGGIQNLREFDADMCATPGKYVIPIPNSEESLSVEIRGAGILP